VIANTPAMGRFLDIGAYHATALSNTRALYEKGWSGVIVEPSPEPFLSLLKTYGNDERITLINAAIGPQGWQTMHATADAVSTTDEGVRALGAAQGGYYGRFQVYQWSLMCQPFASDRFDFVNIDAEGTSGSIFRTALDVWAANLPACICVEHDGHGQELVAGQRIGNSGHGHASRQPGEQLGKLPLQVQARGELNKLRVEKKYYSDKIDDYAYQIKALDSDPNFVEKYAREHYYFSKENLAHDK
jgi:FkbM family methyltransferase